VPLVNIDRGWAQCGAGLNVAPSAVIRSRRAATWLAMVLSRTWASLETRA
jgi:hypothetical protein